MTRLLRHSIAVFAVAGVVVCASASAEGPTTTPATRPIRVAAIGGINEQGFWQTLADRFEAETHIHVDTVATGNKEGAAELFQKGGIDLITMQSTDDIIRLAADGWAMDPQPWVQSDLALVGPEADPAGAKGSTDLIDALRKIAKSKSLLLVHDNSNAHDIIRDATLGNGIELPPDSTVYVLDDHQRRVLTMASERKAYTLISRVPFRTGKLANAGLVVMLEGDARLRRPYLFAIANPGRLGDVHRIETRRLAAFLRSPETQAWIADFGRGKAGDGPLFYPVTVNTAGGAMPRTAAPATLPSTNPVVSLKLSREGGESVTLLSEAFAKLPHETVETTDHNGTHATYSGVPLYRLLDEVGVPLGPQLHGREMALYVVAEASDGYEVTFSLAEVDPDFRDRHILVADTRDGAAQPANEGPLRLIVPEDARQGRWVRMLTSIEVRRAK